MFKVSVLNTLSGRPPIIDYNLAGIIIVDEAHDFEDACLSQISEQITFNDITKCCKGKKYKEELKDALGY